MERKGWRNSERDVEGKITRSKSSLKQCGETS